MQTPNPQISALHQRYCELIGDRCFAVTLTRIFAWDHWLNYPRKFTEDDLVLVVEHIKRKVKENGLSRFNYSFRALIERPEQFEQWLVEANAEKRNTPPKPTVKDKWITKPLDTSKHVSEIMARSDISALVKAAHEACERKEA